VKVTWWEFRLCESWAYAFLHIQCSMSLHVTLLNIHIFISS
jgi:hypothetical protein